MDFIDASKDLSIDVVDCLTCHGQFPSGQVVNRTCAACLIAFAKGGTVDRISKALRARVLRFDNEKDLQEAIALVLLKETVSFEREKALGGELGVIDFLVAGGVGVEVKIDGNPTAVAAQLLRYARSPEIRGLVLVTAKASLGRLPSKVGGKPFFAVPLWEGLLL